MPQLKPAQPVPCNILYLKYIPWEYDYDLLTWQQISDLQKIKKHWISSLD